MGKCCTIPTKYIVASEVYKSNDYEGALEWIRSQRSGRENVGYMFHGPIRLRFDGGWFVAVICIGEESDDGTCDCDIQPEVYDCTETDDPGFCYYLAGIPGLGVFEEGGNCDCGGSGGEDQANTSQGCDKCADTFAPCELGCPDVCSCCWAYPPPLGAEGVACSDAFLVLNHNDIMEHYPEILQDKYCQAPAAALIINPNSLLARLVKHLKDFYFINPDNVNVATFRGPEGECRIEVWARCSCEGCGSGPEPKIYAKEAPMQEPVPEFPAIRMGCACKEAECVTECYDAEDLNVDVVDEWQAREIFGEWTNKTGDSCTGDPCSVCWDCEWWEVDFAGRVCLSKDGERFQDGIYKEQSYSYATINEKEEITLPDECQIIDEWVNEGGYDQYARWRWARVELIENYWQNDPDWATEAKHYDSRVWTQNELQLWVCQQDGKWFDRTADMIVNPECLKSDPDIFCEGWRVADDGTIEECDSNIYDDPAEGLAYWTEVAEVPAFDSLTDCDESFEKFTCPDNGRKREVNPLP